MNKKQNKQRKLSVVVPFYNEEASLAPLYSKLIDNIELVMKEKYISDYEILFVNDGSTDFSEEKIIQIVKQDNRVVLLNMRRNFGKSRALQIAFEYAQGDIVITMDADLQDDPCEIKRFIEKIDEGYDLVSGWKMNRHDPLEKTLPSKIFNFITSKFSGIRLHDFNCGFKAYRKEVVKNIHVYGEFHRYIPILAARNGFKIAEIAVKHHERKYGVSKFGGERYLRGLFDAFSVLFLLKFYYRPMYFFGKIGLLLFGLGFVICSYLSFIWFLGESIGHRPLLILGVLFILVGLQSISFGLLANIIIDKQDQNEAVCVKSVIGGKDDL